MTILKFDREEDHMLTEGKKRSFLGKLSRKIGDALMGRAAVDEEFLEELEESTIKME